MFQDNGKFQEPPLQWHISKAFTNKKLESNWREVDSKQ